jgi:hypothetical protein
VLARLDVEDVYRVVKSASVQQKDDVLAQIDAIAKRANGDVAQKLDTRTDTASTARVREAARLLGEEGLTAYSLGWLALGLCMAGPTHQTCCLARSRSALRHHHPAGVGSVDGIPWIMSCADMMLSCALQLYHTRGTARPDAS